MSRNQLAVPNTSMYKTNTRGTVSTQKSSASRKTKSESKGVKGFFSKVKKAFNGSAVDSDDDSRNLVPVISRKYSRRSSTREAREAIEAEKLREERKSKCLAITVAKRDPPAIQRLLVDCEFCNPPPKYGINIPIPTVSFTSDSAKLNLAEVDKLVKEHADLSDEKTWNVGLIEWIKVREWWLTPTSNAQTPHFLEPELTPDRFYTIYDKMVYHTRPLKHPLSLGDAIKIVKAGWVCEGTWPDADDSDVWSTTDSEEVKAKKEKVTIEVTGPPPNTREDDDGGDAKTEKSSISEKPAAEEEDNASQQPRVQFDNIPVPKRDGPAGTLPLERIMSGAGSGAPLRPIRSTQSSVVSITDSD